DELRCQQFRERVDAATVGLVLLHNAAHRIRDLPAPAVPNGEVHVQAGVRGGAALGGLENLHELVWQALRGTDVLDAPIAVVRQVFSEVGDDLEKAVKLVRVAPAQVVGRQQVQGRDRDAQVVAPDEELAEL